MLSQKQIRDFQEEILSWYKKNKRDLPWRHSRKPYYILVSEVMLQQTQVQRVIPKFFEWMKHFPTIQSLAEAPTRDILQHWSGLGYNRRALYLKNTAEEVVKNHNGVFSQEEIKLKKLPGIGEYTARALLCFAYDKQIALLDTNIKKVITLKFFKGHVPEKKILQKVADQLLPSGRAYEWNQALMDYSSAVLKDKKISLPKQSYFKTSNRFYRGQIVRLLLKYQKETKQSLFQKLENNGITFEEFAKLLLTMEKEGMIQRVGHMVQLP